MARATRKRQSKPAKSPTPEPEPEVEEEEIQEEAEDEEEIEDTQGDEEHDQNGTEQHVLQFDEPITWKAGKQIPVAELLRRLKTLHKELVDVEQDDAERDSFTPIAQELASTNLLEHRDRGVRAWVATCIVETFRILAPNAPYTPNQLKDIFTLFIDTTIPALANPVDPYNDQHLRVLTSLDDVKSIILLTDIAGSDPLMIKLFLRCFDILADSSKNDSEEMLSKNVEYHMTRMLITLVDEAASIPTGVVDMILAQFLRTDPKTFALTGKKGTRNGDSQEEVMQMKESPPPYNMAKNICGSCPEKMSRAISQYFSSVIIDASEGKAASKTKKSTGKRRRGSEDVEDDGLAPSGPSEEDMKELTKAHKLLRELWRSAPLVIQSIIPQLDAELAAENIDLRMLALETIGDLISGIGAAGPPPAGNLDPVAYPSQSLDPTSTKLGSFNFLTSPAAPHAFSSVHPQAYLSFMNRRNDKAPQVRALWTTCAGRILTTSAGGVGLDQDDEADILRYMSDMLLDNDEKVRTAAIQAISRCDFETIVQTIGASGGVNEQGSVLYNLTDRLKDRKPGVRGEAMELLGKLWGVASGAITEGNERITALLGAIPSKILECRYINDPELNKLIHQTTYESLLPLNYPPIKKDKVVNGDSQRVKDSQASQPHRETGPDPDAIRAERILILVNCLESRARTVFFAIQKRQVQLAGVMESFLKRCEEFNGGVLGKEEKDAKKTQLGAVIDFFAKESPDQMTASDHLWKFAKKHDRRSYQLIRFAISPDSDFKKVTRAIVEMQKRIESTTGMSGVLSTLLPVVQSCSVLLYNKNHVHTIVNFSRTDDKGLGPVAHEILREISNNHPEVFKAHVKSMCQALVQEVPAAGAVTDIGTVQTLKACAGFAQRYPQEIPQERDFLQAMVQFALHGSPPEAAKHAVTVIVSIEDKKDMYIKEIVTKCLKGFKYGEGEYLSRLAALSQLMLMAAKDIEDHHDNIISVAIKDVLLTNRAEVVGDEPSWKDEVDDDTSAKIWALKILVNRLRYYASSVSAAEMESTVKEMAEPVYKLLRTVIEQEGELSKDKQTTPAYERSRLRLTASVLLLKLSGASKHFDHLLTHANFNKLALVTQDSQAEVRSMFIGSVKKYLGQARLPSRFYALPFLLAFEPRQPTKDATATWIRARAAALGKASDTTIELTFARFLSLLAHHPDFTSSVEHLRDFVEYMLFYLKTVASKQNISLIYHVAQRVKTIRDGIDSTKSTNLYCLSDIAQAVIREFADEKGWQLPAYVGKIGMPSGIFASISDHAIGQDIAEKNFAPEELLDSIEDHVRTSLRGRKRKSENVANQAKKRTRNSEVKTPKADKVKKTKTPKKKKTRDSAEPASERRRSTRKSNATATSYAGMDESDEDGGEEVDEGEEDEEDVVEEVQDEDEDQEIDVDEDKENDPEPAPESEAEEEEVAEEEPIEVPPPAAKKGKKTPTKAAAKPRKALPTRTARSTRSTRGKAQVVEVEDDEEEDEDMADAE